MSKYSRKKNVELLDDKTIEQIRGEVWKQIQEARPKAIETMVELFHTVESEYTKKDIAYTLLTRLNSVELEEVLSVDGVDAKGIVTRGMDKHNAKKLALVVARESAQQRRHEKREDFALTMDEWTETIYYFDNACSYCGKEGKLTYDHFIPFSKHGPFTKGNIIPACGYCNSSKGATDFKDWYPSKKFYDKDREQRILNFIKEN